VYVLRRERATATPQVSREFVAPGPRNLPPVVWHTPAIGVLEGEALPIEATVAATDPEAVRLELRSGDGPARAIELKPSGPYTYRGAIDASFVKRGVLTYCLSVKQGPMELVFPHPEAGPLAGRLTEREPAPLLTFAKDAAAPELQIGGALGEKAEAEIVAGSQEGRFALRMTATGFGPPPSAVGTRLPVSASGDALKDYGVVVVRARRTQPGTTALEVGLVETDGSAHGYDVPLSDAFQDCRAPFDRMRALWSTPGGTVHPERLAQISLAFGSWLFPDAAREAHGVEVESVGLEYAPPAWQVPVHARQDPIVLFSPSTPIRVSDTPVAWTQSIGPGQEPGSTAWRLAVRRFGPAPNCVGARVDLGPTIRLFRPVIAGRETLHLRARGVEPPTTAVEIVVSERDGTPWGAAPKLTTEWQDILIPLAELRHFAHWGSTPAGRGGEGDHCRAENLATLSLTYGAWLYPEHENDPHAVEIEFLRLE
jgi:hypothetical protein